MAGTRQNTLALSGSLVQDGNQAMDGCNAVEEEGLWVVCSEDGGGQCLKHFSFDVKEIVL